MGGSYRQRSALLWLALVVAACGGPRLNSKKVSQRAFAANERCTQGPLTTHFRATGARWGESISVTVCGTRTVSGRIDVDVDGTWASSGSLLGDASDHSLCRGGEPVAVAEVGAPAKKGDGGGDGAPAVAGRPISPPGRTAPDPFRPVHADRDACFTKPTLELVLGPQKKGADIRVRIWSKLPNDFSGAFIRIRHNRLVPNVSDAKWKAHLAKEERKRRERPARSETVVVAERDTSAPPGPPPPPRVEARGAAPSWGAQWISGYWSWSARGKRWLWVAGSWRRAPSAAHHWRPTRWVQRGGVWIRVPGAWIRIR